MRKQDVDARAARLLYDTRRLAGGAKPPRAASRVDHGSADEDGTNQGKLYAPMGQENTEASNAKHERPGVQNI